MGRTVEICGSSSRPAERPRPCRYVPLGNGSDEGFRTDVLDVATGDVRCSFTELHGVTAAGLSADGSLVTGLRQRRHRRPRPRRRTILPGRPSGVWPTVERSLRSGSPPAAGSAAPVVIGRSGSGPTLRRARATRPASPARSALSPSTTPGEPLPVRRAEPSSCTRRRRGGSSTLRSTTRLRALARSRIAVRDGSTDDRRTWS